MTEKNLVPAYAKHIFKTYGYKKARMFCLRFLLAPATMRDWLQYAHKNHKAPDSEFTAWNFLWKPIRVYVYAGMNLWERIQLIKSHYTIAPKKFHEAEKILTTIKGKSGQEYEIVLAQLERYRREGELSVLMRDASDGVLLAIMTFVLGKKPDGSNFMLIGGMQGPAVESGKERVVKATRDLNGLRPKNAVLNALYSVASFFEVKTIEAISIANHPVKKTNQRKQKNFFADYDSFWQEVTTTKNAVGNFVLPQILPRKKLEEVPSKKKKDWLKRQQYIADLAASCLLMLGA